jgi:putative transposase
METTVNEMDRRRSTATRWPGEAGVEGHRGGKLLSPERRRCAVDHAQQQHGLSERWACRVVEQPRGTQRNRPTQREDEDRLTEAIIQLAKEYGRYGYRRITALLVQAAWKGGKDRVERIWRREGLKVPKRQKPRGRLWLNDGSCVRLRPTHRNYMWSYDFISVRTHDGRTARVLNLIDEHTRESLLVRAEGRWSSAKVIEALADVMVIKGVPEHLRSDNGPGS